MTAIGIPATSRSLTTEADAVEVAAEVTRLKAKRPHDDVVGEALLIVLTRRRMAATGEDELKALRAVSREHPDLATAFRFATRSRQ